MKRTVLPSGSPQERVLRLRRDSAADQDRALHRLRDLPGLQRRRRVRPDHPERHRRPRAPQPPHHGAHRRQPRPEPPLVRPDLPAVEHRSGRHPGAPRPVPAEPLRREGVQGPGHRRHAAPTRRVPRRRTRCRRRGQRPAPLPGRAARRRQPQRRRDEPAGRVVADPCPDPGRGGERAARGGAGRWVPGPSPGPARLEPVEGGLRLRDPARLVPPLPGPRRLPRQRRHGRPVRPAVPALGASLAVGHSPHDHRLRGVRGIHPAQGPRLVDLSRPERRESDRIGLSEQARTTPTLHRVTGERPPDEQRYRLLFEQSPSPQLLLDEDLRFVEVNEAACVLLGRTATELIGMPWVSVVHPDERTESLAAGREAVRRRREVPFYRTDRRLILPDDRSIKVVATGVHVTDDGGAHADSWILVTLQDVTSVRQAQAQLAHATLHDPLTGLPNKRLLADRISQALTRSKVEGRDVVLAYLDLDHVQRVNDSLGLEQGDLLLAAVARNLRATLSATDTIAHVVGDEFVVVREGVDDSEQALSDFGDLVLAAVSRPVVVGEHELVVSASAGLVRADSGSGQPAELLRQGQRAAQVAKREGRARWVIAVAGSPAGDVRLRVEHELRDALTRGELTLHYQPLVRVDGELVGFEALLRWQHPTRGILAPDEFLGFAEQSILSAGVTAWVIDHAVRDPAERLRPGVSVSVNVPIEDLRRDDFVDRTLDTLVTYGLPPQQLKIELLENQLADAVDGPIERLIAAGVQFVVDDFGTGYSALAYLKRLPVASVKIDRSFVVGITDDPVDASIVRAIVDACRATGRTCLAEGVERASQALLLAELGVDTLQGDLLARPAPLAAYTEIIETARMKLAPTLAVASVLRVAPRLGES